MEEFKVGDMVILEITESVVPVHNPYIIKEICNGYSWLDSVTPNPSERHVRLEHSSHFKKIVVSDNAQRALDDMFDTNIEEGIKIFYGNSKN